MNTRLVLPWVILVVACGTGEKLQMADTAPPQPGAMTVSALAATQYMSSCTDGDGALTAWLDSYDSANEAGKSHEQATRGHRWTILTRQKPEATRSTLKSTDSLVSAAFVPGMSADPPTCEGTACEVTAYRWSNGNYFKNNSPNRTITIAIENGVAGESFDLAPGQERRSFLMVFISPYKSNYK